MPQTRDLYSKKLILRCHCSEGRRKWVSYFVFNSLSHYWRQTSWKKSQISGQNVIKFPVSWKKVSIVKISWKEASLVEKGEHRENQGRENFDVVKNFSQRSPFFERFSRRSPFFTTLKISWRFDLKIVIFFPMLFHDIFTDLYEITRRFHSFFTMFAASNDQCEQFYQSTFMKSFWGFLWRCLR